MGKQRPKKRYGPAHSRGIYYSKPWDKPRAPKEQAKWYTIPAGTICHVRKIGEKDWVPHRTMVAINCHGFLWRNETCYGFAQLGYEVKMRVGDFIVGGDS